MKHHPTQEGPTAHKQEYLYVIVCIIVVHRLVPQLIHVHLLIRLVKCDDFIFFQHVFYLFWAVGIDIQIHCALTVLSGI